MTVEELLVWLRETALERARVLQDALDGLPAPQNERDIRARQRTKEAAFRIYRAELKAMFEIAEEIVIKESLTLPDTTLRDLEHSLIKLPFA